MARPLSQTLIRTAASSSSPFSVAVKPKLLRRHLSSLADGNSYIELSLPEAEARAVERIEDAIHTIITERSRPDWLPFVPGASYWVPPRQHLHGVTKIVQRLLNTLTEEEFNSLTTLQGWPSSALHLSHDASSHLAEGETASKDEECILICL